VLLPQHLQHADAAALPEHPFFVLQRGEQLTPAATPTTATAAAAAAAAAAGGQLPARGTHKQAAGSAAAAAGKAGPQEAGLEGLDAAAAAAAAAASVYTSLDLLELRLIQMRSKLAAAYGIEAGERSGCACCIEAGARPATGCGCALSACTATRPWLGCGHPPMCLQPPAPTWPSLACTTCVPAAACLLNPHS
jgi:hypothetical protein